MSAVNHKTLMACVLGLLPPAAMAAPSPAGRCPSIPAFIAQMDSIVPDLGGGGDLVDESEAVVEPLGSKECPQTSATQCQKLTYMTFMLSLMDMSPGTYRRPGIAAFLANVMAEDSSFGSQCSAERINHTPKSFRSNFSKPYKRFFCTPGGAGYNSALAAGIIDPEGTCKLEQDETLAKLNTQVLSESPAALATRPEYRSRLAPLVTRIYRYKFDLPNDEDAFGYRGRGFIQITGKESYQLCQDDIKYAKSYLARNHGLAERVARRTGVDWSKLDVRLEPSEVSHNLYVASFCAASYWNHRVAAKELVWPDDSAIETFKQLALAVNPDGDKAEARVPGFTKWCQTAHCASNAPRNLRVDVAFGQLVGLPGGGK